MTLRSDLEAEVTTIFKEPFSSRNGQVVPSDTDLKLSNDAVKLDGTVLYADISDSTKLVDGHRHHFSAEVYKAFLRCSAKIIRSEGGSITAFDGDRIMAVFLGGSKNSAAAKAALKINWAVREVINPSIKAQYPDVEYQLKHTVGIDTSEMFVVRGGIRGSNDLLWISRAANHAAKLTTLDDGFATWITKDVYDGLDNPSKIATDGRNMWESRSWTAMNGQTIYRSSFWWSL